MSAVLALEGNYRKRDTTDIPGDALIGGVNCCHYQSDTMSPFPSPWLVRWLLLTDEINIAVNN
jgi:hypothetical protein